MKKRFNTKNGVIVSLLVILTILLGAGNQYFRSHTNEQTLYFGVGGPFTGKYEYYGREMIRGIELCIDQVNADGGIDGKLLKFIKGDDRNVSSFAMTVASNFAKKDILFVLGHYSSQASVAAGRVYMKEGIPAVTASAPADIITKNNEWYFRTIPSASQQTELIASFASNQLNMKSFIIVYAKDILGHSLKDALTNVAQGAGIKIEKAFDIDFEKPIPPQIFKICKQIKAFKHCAVFLAVKADIAARLIKKLKLMNINVTILGTNTISNEGFYRAIQDMPLEKAIPGYYTDGIVATASDIFGRHLFNDASILFNKQYYRRYKMPSTSIAAGYYDATLTMVEVLRQVEFSEHTTLVYLRRFINNVLADIKKPDYAVNGICGDIFFDNKGNAIKSVGLGQYYKGKLIPYHQQFVLNMNSDIEKSYLIESAYKELSVVKVKTTICNLNIKKNAFTAHCILTFIYKNKNIDFSNIVFLNQLSPVSLGQPIDEQTVDGFIHKRYGIDLTFKKSANTTQYTFNRQILTISLKHSSSQKPYEIRFMPQGVPTYNINKFNIPGWKFANIYSYGNFDKEKKEPLFHIVANISRNYVDLHIKCLIPGVLILCMLLSVYIICPTIRTNAVIILMACLGLNYLLHVNFKEVQIDNTPYDVWFMFLYVMIFISLLMVLMISALKQTGRTKAINWVKLLGSILHLGGLGYWYYFLKGFDY